MNKSTLLFFSLMLGLMFCLATSMTAQATNIKNKFHNPIMVELLQQSEGGSPAECFAKDSKVQSLTLQPGQELHAAPTHQIYTVCFKDAWSGGQIKGAVTGMVDNGTCALVLKENGTTDAPSDCK